MTVVGGRDLDTLRLFVGYLPGRRQCTSQIELDAEHRRLWICLASVSRFSVALDADAVDMLIAALSADEVCAVACEHEVKGRWLLGAHPHTEPGALPYFERELNAALTGGPMVLYLYLSADPSQRVEIVFTRSVTNSIIAHLQCCRVAMSGE